MIEKTLEIIERYLHSYKDVNDRFKDYFHSPLEGLTPLIYTKVPDKRKKQIRNLYSYLDRRKKVKNGGYPKSSICSGCGRAITENYELCRDCKR